jgi:hypothetical protein
VPLASAAGETIRLRARVVNLGDTRWLATAVDRYGWARLGVYLYRGQCEHQGDAAGEPASEAALDFDWLRASLPRDLDPGEEATLDVELPLLEPGAYRLVFDLVAEQVCWFAERGSTAVTVPLVVTPAPGPRS